MFASYRMLPVCSRVHEAIEKAARQADRFYRPCRSVQSLFQCRLTHLRIPTVGSTSGIFGIFLSIAPSHSISLSFNLKCFLLYSRWARTRWLQFKQERPYVWIHANHQKRDRPNRTEGPSQYCRTWVKCTIRYISSSSSHQFYHYNSWVLTPMAEVAMNDKKLVTRVLQTIAMRKVASSADVGACPPCLPIKLTKSKPTLSPISLRIKRQVTSAGQS